MTNEQPDYYVQPVAPSLLKPGALLKRAWSIYKERWMVFVGIAALPAVITLVVNLLSREDGTFSGSLASQPKLVYISAILGGILFIVLYVWSQIALLQVLKSDPEKIGVMNAFKKSWKYVGSYFWLGILLVSIVMGGMLLLIVPGIIFAFWFTFAPFILVNEDVKGMNALFKSREYVRGKIGAIFWRFLCVGVLAFAVSIVMHFIIAIAHVPHAQDVAGFITSLFFAPFVTVYWVMIYRSAKAVSGEVSFVATKGRKTKFIAVGVFGLIAIPMIVIGIFALKVAREKSRDAVRENAVWQLKGGLERYFDDKAAYPASLNELSPDYVTEIPTDRWTGEPYKYMQKGEGYTLCAVLEKGPEKCVTE